jgi:hypothetical protein
LRSVVLPVDTPSSDRERIALHGEGIETDAEPVGIHDPSIPVR